MHFIDKKVPYVDKTSIFDLQYLKSFAKKMRPKRTKTIGL